MKEHRVGFFCCRAWSEKKGTPTKHECLVGVPAYR